MTSERFFLIAFITMTCLCDLHFMILIVINMNITCNLYSLISKNCCSDDPWYTHIGATQIKRIPMYYQLISLDEERSPAVVITKV